MWRRSGAGRIADSPRCIAHIGGELLVGLFQHLADLPEIVIRLILRRRPSFCVALSMRVKISAVRLASLRADATVFCASIIWSSSCRTLRWSSTIVPIARVDAETASAAAEVPLRLQWTVQKHPRHSVRSAKLVRSGEHGSSALIEIGQRGGGDFAHAGNGDMDRAHGFGCGLLVRFHGFHSLGQGLRHGICRLATRCVDVSGHLLELLNGGLKRLDGFLLQFIDTDGLATKKILQFFGKCSEYIIKSLTEITPCFFARLLSLLAISCRGWLIPA